MTDTNNAHNERPKTPLEDARSIRINYVPGAAARSLERMENWAEAYRASQVAQAPSIPQASLQIAEAPQMPSEYPITPSQPDATFEDSARNAVWEAYDNAA